ncbi:MAG: hypothetical protein QOK00_1484 [Thermoleophilaceae bacterium]|jgi:integrase|nr:hypothetical protein [Thermoleophilaceae bacterium]
MGVALLLVGGGFLVVTLRVLRQPSSATRRKVRSFLHPHQIKAALDAAGLLEIEAQGLTWEKVRYIRASDAPAVTLARELRISDVTIGKVRRGLIWTDEAGPRRRNDIARRAMIATLLMAGVRVSELCGLRGRHVDFAASRLDLTRDITKTDAGVRVIPMVPALREILLAHRMAWPFGAEDPVFPTRNGRPNTPDNVRSTIIDAVRDRANELLAERDEQTIGHMTPHSLRRTFASVLAELDVTPRRAMYLLGHTNAKFTMGVYQQILDMSKGGIATLESVLGGPADDLRDLLSGRQIGGGLDTQKTPSLNFDAGEAF